MSLLGFPDFHLNHSLTEWHSAWDETDVAVNGPVKRAATAASYQAKQPVMAQAACQIRNKTQNKTATTPADTQPHIYHCGSGIERPYVNPAPHCFWGRPSHIPPGEKGKSLLKYEYFCQSSNWKRVKITGTESSSFVIIKEKGWRYHLSEAAFTPVQFNPL